MYRNFTWLITPLLLACLNLAEAQQPQKVPQIGFLFSGSKDQPHLKSFLQALRELGYVEGKNIQVAYRYAEGRNDALPGLAAEFVTRQVAVILTTTAEGNRAALKATSKIPIVSVGGGDPVALGTARSLADPGGNLTGLSSTAGPGIMGKRLELLKAAFPNVVSVSYLWNPDARDIGPMGLEDAQTGAKVLGLQLRPIEIRNVSDTNRAIEELKARLPHALMVSGGPIMMRNSSRIVEIAATLRLPAMYSSPQFVENGGLMAYGVNFAHLYRRAAYYVDRILKGAKPSDLPVEQPSKFEFVINLKTAKQIGLTMPPHVLARADRVIK
jgi:putative ABC transport system substrate-binding protein